MTDFNNFMVAKEASTDSSEKPKSRFPLFISPEKLTFYAKDLSTGKQILTIFNPYKFLVKFKVFCTAPRTYIVSLTKGTIEKNCCCDIVIRRKNLYSESSNTVDKFKVESYYLDSNKSWNLFGSREIPVSINQTEDNSENLISSNSEAEKVFSSFPKQSSVDSSKTKSYLVAAVVICILAINLPTVGEEVENQLLPRYLSLTVFQKMIISYILGLLTTAIFN